MIHRHLRRRHLMLSLAMAALPAALPTAAAEGDADYRHHVMEAVGGHMQSAADILRRKVSHDAHLGVHARALAELAEIAPLLFPEGSQGGDALPAIWENGADFDGKMRAFQDAARAFRSAVAAGDGVAPAFQNLGQSCKSCHDSYRAD